MPLHPNPEFRACLQILIKEQQEANLEFLHRVPTETWVQEIYTRGLLQGSAALLEKLVQLGKEDLLRKEEEDHEQPIGPESVTGSGEWY